VGDGVTKTVKTNGFGDFQFDGLADAAKYTVSIAAPGYKAASCETKTLKDIYLGEIVLSK
jgi:hypothetical protein